MLARLSLSELGMKVMSEEGKFEEDDTVLLELDARECTLIALALRTTDDPILGLLGKHPVGLSILRKMTLVAFGKVPIDTDTDDES
jgi:hypothetical protein